MEINPSDYTKNDQDKPKKHNHLMMMLICCGLPIVAVAAITAFGFSFNNIENLLFLACPIGMGIMMYMMNKSGQKKSCCQQEEETKPMPLQNINEVSPGPNYG